MSEIYVLIRQNDYDTFEVIVSSESIEVLERLIREYESIPINNECLFYIEKVGVIE